MARQFDDGANQYLRSGSAPATATPLTMACWAYIDADKVSGILGIGDSAQAANQWQYLLWRHSTNDRLSLMRADGGGDYIYSSNNMFPINTWTHCCAVCAADNDAALFTNGGDKQVSAVDKGPAGYDNATVGAQASTASTYWDGRIAEAAIWNAALADDEVAALAGGVSPTRIRPGSLQAYWPLYGVDSPEPDYRGTYDLTLNNGPTQEDHAPVQVPFGYAVSWIEPTAAAPAVGQPMQLRCTQVPHIRQWQPRIP